MSSAICFNLDQSKILLSGNWLILWVALSIPNSFLHNEFRLFQTYKNMRQQFQIQQNGEKFSERVESSVGKGEIACFSFSNRVFKILVLQTRKNKGFFRRELILYSIDASATDSF